MEGFKTILVGLGMAVLPVVTQYLGAIDWNAVLPAPYSFVAAGITMIVMRLITKTPVFGGKG